MAYKRAKLWTKEKAAVYIRVSTAYQVDKDSLPLQRKMCAAYCDMHGLEYEVFEDAGVSAKSEKRAAYQDMMKRFRDGEFSHLVVYKLDRISRNLLDFMSMYEELEGLRVTFVSLNENFDTNSAMGKAMLAIMVIFAQMEREIDSERVLSVMIGRAENDRPEVNNGNGLWNGAQTPFGFKFDYDIKYPVPDENELPTLHLIYDMYETERSTLQVARYLNRNNIPSKRGGKWTSKVVGDIIKNRFNIGEYSYNKRESGRGPYKPADEWVIRPDNHPGVIDPGQFERCNEILRTNRKEQAKPNIKHIHIFQGILKCHRCGGGTTCSKDRRRLNGIAPSVYSCLSRRTDGEEGCTNSSNISDYVVGNFVFPFLMNYYRAYRNFRTIAGKEDPLTVLEEQLLKGPEFHGVAIKDDSLKKIYNVLMKSSGIKKKTYYTFEDPDFESRQRAAEDERKRKELEKYDTALRRLTDLYLYEEDGMSRKDYMDKKKELESKRKEVEAELEKQDSGAAGDNEPSAIDRKEYSALFLQIGITDSSYGIKFKDIYNNVDHKILKDFLASIIERIAYDSAKIFSIRFVNGLECGFEHESLTDAACPVCGGGIWNTVGCRRRTLPIGGQAYRRIKMGDPGDYYHDRQDEVCEDCGVQRGRWHHYGCRKESCPVCGKPLCSCGHLEKTDLEAIRKI